MSWVDMKRLDEVGTISRGKSKHRPRNDPKLYGGQYPFVQTADVKNAGLYLYDYEQTYNETGLAQSKLWEPGTLCITIAANIADTCILGIPACFPDSIMGFTPDDNKCDVRYMKYSFDMLQKQMKQISQGATQDNLSWQKLATIQFPIPAVGVQRQIAETISAYDNLIENNRKQIALLEEAAQRLYKEWFVDLRFPGHANVQVNDGIPDGWSIRTLTECCDVVRGRSYTSDEIDGDDGIALVNLKNLRSFGGWNDGAEKTYSGAFKDEQHVVAGDIIMGVTDMTKERRLVGHVALVPELRREAIISMDLVKLVPKNVGRLYLYAVLRYSGIAESIALLANGTNVLHLKPQILSSVRLTLPTEELQNQFGSFMLPLIREIDLTTRRMAQLTEARDRLLPKLMSGEIEV